MQLSRDMDLNLISIKRWELHQQYLVRSPATSNQGWGPTSEVSTLAIEPKTRDPRLVLILLGVGASPMAHNLWTRLCLEWGLVVAYGEGKWHHHYTRCFSLHMVALLLICIKYIDQIYATKKIKILYTLLAP